MNQELFDFESFDKRKLQICRLTPEGISNILRRNPERLFPADQVALDKLRSMQGPLPKAALLAPIGPRMVEYLKLREGRPMQVVKV